MSLWTMTRNWGQLAARATAYGTISCTVGALTPGPAVSQWAMRRWCTGSADGAGIRRELIHGERLATAPQCVIVANHLSLIDILVLGSFIERDYRWVAKEGVFKVPFLGWHLHLAGHIPVYRKERERNRELPERVHRAVTQGASLLFFPEGTRSEEGHLKPFRIGAFASAVRENLPVLPLVVRGTGELMQKGAKDLAIHKDRTCTVTVLPLIQPPLAECDEKARAHALRDATWQAFHAELYPETVAPPTPAHRTDAPRRAAG